MAHRHPNNSDPRDERDELTPEERRLAGRVRSARPADLPPEAVRRIENRMLARFAGTQPARRPASAPWLTRLAAAFAAALALLTVGAGVVAAASNSLPGEALYPVKRLAEDVRLAASAAPERPALLAEQAAVRLSEVESLAGRGTVDPAVVQDMAAATDRALAAAETLSDGPKADVLGRLVEVSARQQAVLETVRANAPAPAQAALDQAAERIRNGHDRAAAALSAAGAEPPPPVPEKSATPTTEAATATATDIPAGVSATPAPGAAATHKPDQPPGQVKTPPGQAGTPPGLEKTPPGQAKTPAPGNNNGGGNGTGNGHGGKP